MAKKSNGSKTKWLVPSDQILFKANCTRPSGNSFLGFFALADYLDVIDTGFAAYLERSTATAVRAASLPRSTFTRERMTKPARK